METFVSIRRSEVPKYLHNSEFYLSLDESDEEISVPSNCMKMNESVNSLFELENILFTLRYWIRTTFPHGLIKYIVHSVQVGVREVLLPFADDFPRVIPLLDAMNDSIHYDFCSLAAKFGRVDFLDYFYKALKLQISGQTLRNAAVNGYLDCLEYGSNALKHNGIVDWPTGGAVAGAGHLDCLKFLIEHGTPPFFTLWCSAAFSGQLACLQYLASVSDTVPSDATTEAVKGHQLHCLKYLMEQGCAVERDTWKAAVALRVPVPTAAPVYSSSDPLVNTSEKDIHKPSYNPDCLRYLLNTVSPPPPVKDQTAIVRAACRNGHIEALQLLHQHGYPFCAALIAPAAKSGSMECLDFLHNEFHLDCWVPSTMAEAAGEGQLKLVTQLHEMGCPWDDTALQAAFHNSHSHCYIYLAQQRGILKL